MKLVKHILSELITTKKSDLESKQRQLKIEKESMLLLLDDNSSCIQEWVIIRASNIQKAAQECCNIEREIGDLEHLLEQFELIEVI